MEEWRQTCIEARGKATVHHSCVDRITAAPVPTLQCDYIFLDVSKELDPCVVMSDRTTSNLHGSMVLSKGPTCPYSISAAAASHGATITILHRPIRDTPPPKSAAVQTRGDHLPPTGGLAGGTTDGGADAVRAADGLNKRRGDDVPPAPGLDNGREGYLPPLTAILHPPPGRTRPRPSDGHVACPGHSFPAFE